MKARHIGDATLLLGDAFNIMPTLDPVDVIITDPPYARQTHEGARTMVNGRSTRFIDFDSMAEEEFLTFCTNAVALARRWVVLSCEWRYVSSLERAGLPLARFGVWHKLDGAPQFSGDRPAMGWEAIAILHREGKKHWNGGGHPAVWACRVERGDHPAQKPLALVADWVKKFTEPGETVLDPLMGSGTTGVACARLGCKFIGIEKRPDYFEIACRRIAETYAQAQLFPTRGADPMPGLLL